MFLLPALGFNISVLSNYGLDNVYIGDHKYEILYENHLYLLFSPNEFNSQFEEFCEKLRDNKLYEDEYDVEVGKVMFVFRFPDNLKQTFKHFQQGKYSKFDKEYIKNAFPAINSHTKKPSLIYKVLTKHPKFRMEIAERFNVDPSIINELWSKPSPEEEIYNFNKEIYDINPW